MSRLIVSSSPNNHMQSRLLVSILAAAFLLLTLGCSCARAGIVGRQQIIAQQGWQQSQQAPPQQQQPPQQRYFDRRQQQDAETATAKQQQQLKSQQQQPDPMSVGPSSMFPRLGLSAWGLIALIVFVILLGMSVYYAVMCYPLFCNKDSPYYTMREASSTSSGTPLGNYDEKLGNYSSRSTTPSKSHE